MEASSTISKFFNADTARWFDLLIEGIVILDEKQRFVYANQAYRNHVHMDDETYAKYQGKLSNLSGQADGPAAVVTGGCNV